MAFLPGLKLKLVRCLAFSNRLGRSLGLNIPFLGPVGATSFLAAGGQKVATILPAKTVYLPNPLILHPGTLKEQAQQGCNGVKEIHFDEVALWEYRFARIRPGAHGGLHGISGNNIVIPGLNHSCLDESLFFETRVGSTKFPEKIESGLILDGSAGANHYHWTIDILPVLGAPVRDYIKNIPLIVNPYTPERVDQWNELSLPSHRYALKTNALVDRLYAVSGLSSDIYGVFRPEPCLGFWSGFAKPSRSGRKLFISRSDTNKRLLVNEGDLFSRLERLGFEKVTLRGLKLRDQASLFAEASIVIGMHGAGFANMIHALPNTKLVEIFPPGYSHCFYQYVCFLKNCLYYPIFSEYPQANQDANTEFNSKHGFLAMDKIDKILSVCY